MYWTQFIVLFPDVTNWCKDNQSISCINCNKLMPEQLFILFSFLGRWLTSWKSNKVHLKATWMLLLARKYVHIPCSNVAKSSLDRTKSSWQGTKVVVGIAWMFRGALLLLYQNKTLEQTFSMLSHHKDWHISWECLFVVTNECFHPTSVEEIKHSKRSCVGLFGSKYFLSSLLKLVSYCHDI